ncbi:hypothetical protein ACH4FE_30405 [Streptomyces celluloflavus]|uniref:hypothetical protein n=1 Tax=Streptomyces celluloflavus TaxID=58344 RepID=UPI00378BD5F7
MSFIGPSHGFQGHEAAQLISSFKSQPASAPRAGNPIATSMRSDQVWRITVAAYFRDDEFPVPGNLTRPFLRKRSRDQEIKRSRDQEINGVDESSK